MSERNVIQRTFDEFGASIEMIKRSGSWYRSSESVITVFNLQKSQYSRKYYINVGFWLLGAAAAQFPKVHTCHVNARLDELLPDETKEIEALLDLEYPIGDDLRAERLRALLDARLKPLLDQGGSIDGLKDLNQAGAFRAAGVMGVAQQLLR